MALVPPEEEEAFKVHFAKALVRLKASPAWAAQLSQMLSVYDHSALAAIIAMQAHRKEQGKE